MEKKFDYIDSDREVIAFSARIAGANWLSVDTEFMRERTYYARLALIQVASDRGNALIDVPALRSLAPLHELFTHRDCLKIMHSASQDLEVLGQALGEIPAPLFDTQIAAGFLGEAEQISYAAIVKQRLGIELDKDQTRTDWLKRPLSPAQLRYAEDDVLYLHALYEQLSEELNARGRFQWAYGESQALVDKYRGGNDPDQAWQTLKGLERMNPTQQQVARELASWREQRAQQRDLPREWVLKKQALLEIASIQPERLGQLDAVSGLNPKTRQRIGGQLLKVVARARGRVDMTAVRSALTASQRGQVKKLAAKLREIAGQQSIAPALIANRNTLERLVSGEQNLPLLAGWRNDVAGRALLALLQGNDSGVEHGDDSTQ